MAELSTLDSTGAEAGNTSPAQVHPAFTWRRSEKIASLNLVMEEYVHRRTGALHYHLSSDNPENVFLVAFRTVPMDSTGVAHILEHTALCGSARYPVRDPFFMMIRRSLNTFMNAFTSSDWTAYPFASKNRKDFNNLLSVYLDAAFFARLDELDFLQEGHRLEFDEADNPDSELLFKGVVYNEMKGAMSSTNSVLWQCMSKHLFPTTTYHYNSGGEPEDIPDLRYQDLVSFYKSHYHPSNAVFMTYGDIPAADHHQQFENLALGQFDKLDVNISVDDEQRYPAPQRFEESYAADDSDHKSHVVVGWLLGKSTELADLFRTQLLSAVLLDNSASPLQQALETSELGSSPSPMCGLEDSNREMTFMAGLEGCEHSSAAAVESLVLSTLEKICETGVAQDQVEAALHQLELHQREISGDSYPYGLQLILTCLSTAMHRSDPIKLLNIDPVLAELREEVNNPDFIPQLVRELLLDNPHRITLSLHPDTELDHRKLAAEKTRLASIRQSMTGEQQEQVIRRARELAERQMQEDDPDILPKVGLEDVPAEIVEPRHQEVSLEQSGLPLTYYAQGTNGLAYQQAVITMPQLPDELLSVLPLYSSCLPEFGVGGKDYAEVQTWQAQVSGGLNCFSSIRSDLADEQGSKALLTFSSKALMARHDKMSELLSQTFSEVRFDEPRRLAELIEQICARKENSITSQGHSLAMNLASSRMSPTAQLTHCFGGLEGIRRLKHIKEGIEEPANRELLLQQFSELHRLVTAAPRQFLLITEPEFQELAIRQLDAAWSGHAAGADASALELPPLREQLRQAWTTSTQVNFCAKAYPTVPAGHADSAALHVLAGFMRNGFLHRAIREQGGAYGGGAGQDANSASFRFFSYRDPRLEATLDDFDRAVEWVLAGQHPDYQLEEAILGVIASMDKPSSPAGEAKQAFYNHLFGRSLEHRMAFRRQVLATTLADLKAVAERYFVPQRASFGVITNRDLAEGLKHREFEIINI